MCGMNFWESYAPVLQVAHERAAGYLQALPDRRANPEADALDRLASVLEDLPDDGLDAAATIEMLDDLAARATVPSTNATFFGGVIGGALPASVGANWLAGIWDQNACLYEFSPAAAELERAALAWVRSLLGLPAESAAVLVAGTQSAHVAALAAARHELLSKAGWDVEADGLFGAPEIDVVVGDEAHATLFKAMRIVGLGSRRVIRVPTDAQGRMDVVKIPKLRPSSILCVQAGNVNSGACDDIAAACAVARESGAWVHVDGAFGLWAAASKKLRRLVEGLEMADSWATDAHKCLNVSYDCGIAIVKRAEALAAAMTVSGAYYPVNDAKLNGMMLSPDSSRRARGIELWATLRSLGRSGVAELVERLCSNAARFARALEREGFKILNDVVLNQVVACLPNDDATRRLIGAVRADGTCFTGGTVWRGRYAMRVSVCSWATTAQDIDRCAALIGAIAHRILT